MSGLTEIKLTFTCTIATYYSESIMKGKLAFMDNFNEAVNKSLCAPYMVGLVGDSRLTLEGQLDESK